MATYLELHGLQSDSDLQDKVAVAIVIAAETIRTEGTPTAPRLTWAKQAMADPKTEARRMLWAILATNASISVAQIKGATDTAIQTQVDAAVDLFA